MELSGHLHAPAALHPRKEPQVSIAYAFYNLIPYKFVEFASSSSRSRTEWKPLDVVMKRKVSDPARN
jgi:hypothetical protein